MSEASRAGLGRNEPTSEGAAAVVAPSVSSSENSKSSPSTSTSASAALDACSAHVRSSCSRSTRSASFSDGWTMYVTEFLLSMNFLRPCALPSHRMKREAPAESAGCEQGV